jgi:hypothetical protein
VISETIEICSGRSDVIEEPNPTHCSPPGAPFSQTAALAP